MIVKYPPIQGGVSRDCYWLARLFAEMGHEVTVVTNAFEVEDQYRLALEPEDDSYLQGKFEEGSIRLVKTSIDPRHMYIPQNNPTVSKLVGLSLEAIAHSRPDLIYSHYLEPYGFTAMIVSAISGIPYVIRHAGSDVGRLMLTEQLKPAYIEVFRRAKVVLGSARMYGTFLSFGIQPDQIMNISVNYLHPNFFTPSNEEVRYSDVLTLGIYGKAGRGKGSFALLRAIRYLKNQGENVRLKARWGGREMSEVHKSIADLNIQDKVDLLPFVPQWRIPDFIHSCDASLFLEHSFSITQHSPSVPRELLTCGAAIIITSEIAQKTIYRKILTDGYNCLVLGDPKDTPAVAEKILMLKDIHLRTTLSCNAGKTLSTSEMRERAVRSVNILLEAALE